MLSTRLWFRKAVYSLGEACVNTHDLIICLIQQAANLTVPLQHVSWHLQQHHNQLHQTYCLLHLTG